MGVKFRFLSHCSERQIISTALPQRFSSRVFLVLLYYGLSCGKLPELFHLLLLKRIVVPRKLLHQNLYVPVQLFLSPLGSLLSELSHSNYLNYPTESENHLRYQHKHHKKILPALLEFALIVIVPLVSPHKFLDLLPLRFYQVSAVVSVDYHHPSQVYHLCSGLRLFFRTDSHLGRCGTTLFQVTRFAIFALEYLRKFCC